MANGENTVTLTIDGREVTVEKGNTIKLAAEKLDIPIPHFCFHDDLSWLGTCRMCLVEVEKAPKLATACCAVAADGMVVRTNTDKVRAARRAVLEFLLLSHPIDCPICDQAGECYLQDYYMEYGLHNSRFHLADKTKKRKAHRLSDMIVLDRERCILCRRCVRFTAEVSKTCALNVQHRGDKTEIATFNNQPLEDPYQGNVADICPVGALTSAKFRFKCRVWFLSRTPSVCASCSTGCNINVDQNKETVQRFTARRNLLVNCSWICDEGRMSWERLHGDSRLTAPTVAGRAADWAGALETVAQGIEKARKAGGGSIAVIASPDATNEENWLLKKYAVETLGAENLDFRVDDTWDKTGDKEDEILRRVDKHPNSKGAVALGMNTGSVKGILGAAAAGKLKALLIFNNDIVGKLGEKAEAAMKAVPLTVYFGEMNDKTAAAATVALPIAAFTEKDGTFINYQGRVQRIRQAVLPRGEIRDALAVLAELMNRAGGEAAPADAEGIFALIAGSVSACSGLSYEAIGETGRAPGEAVAAKACAAANR